MIKNSGFFLNKKILVYGLGKSGLSAFKFLNNKNDVFLYDDDPKIIKNLSIKKKIISFKGILKSNFDRIIISPGININNCKLSKFLKQNKAKIFSDLDVFYSFYKNDCITITGTNGKSTTCQLLYEVLLNQNFDVRLVGNIGFPILSATKVKSKTIFVVEASSYQLDYSKIFQSKYAVILNISPDHLERHKTLSKYIKAKFKLIKNQPNNSYSFVKKNDPLIEKTLRLNKFKNKIIKVDVNNFTKFLKKVKNKFFLNETVNENLSFVFKISEKLGLNKSKLIKTIKKFKGLKYRQQIIFQNPNLIIINDSKSTSFSATHGILKLDSNIFWLLGGIPKKGDKFKLPQKYFYRIKAFVYGKKFKFFNQVLKNKIYFENFYSLKEAFKRIFFLIKKDKFKHKTILFSPCAASFDSFKNFEDRGLYFNKLVSKHLNGK
tara:strand:- start:8074 stop:9375 length:1302 start_codon:yes stop_codon:yes gene_type:complete